MQITKPTKAEVMRELKDYVFITFGLISYAMGWAAFLIPYQITTGGTTGIGAIIYYATGFPIQWSYFIINAVLMTFAIKILGPKFSIKTTFAFSKAFPSSVSAVSGISALQWMSFMLRSSILSPKIAVTSSSLWALLVAKVCGCLHNDKFSGTDNMVPVYENRKFHVIRA